jgi:ComF family protein
VANRSPCRCAELPPVLSRLRSALPYEGWARQSIISLKFHDEAARAEHLGRHLSPALAEFGAIDGLVPVPLHPRRLRERGFNQALLLARHAAAGQVAVRDDLLVRIRPTPHQVGLGAEQRGANVHGAFAVPPGLDLTEMNLVLIDDVLTTGSTLGACAEALTVAGAASVGALTLARE